MRYGSFDWRWPNFSPEELLSPVGMKLFRNGHLMINETSVDKLQKLRNKVGGLLVNYRNLELRGYRSPEEHDAIKSPKGKYSAHVQGRAFDISPIDTDFWLVVDEAAAAGFTYIAYYEDKGFIHVDDRIRLSQN